MNEKLFNVKLP